MHLILIPINIEFTGKLYKTEPIFAVVCLSGITFNSN